MDRPLTAISTAQSLPETMQISATDPRLFASIDMGTNSFKLLLVRAHPNGRFLNLDRIKEPVVLGRGMPSEGEGPVISLDSQRRAISALQKFASTLNQYSVDHFSIVATSAVREARNQAEFLSTIHRDLGFKVRVLSGEDEARLIYLGILQFRPLSDETILTVDIGGGSTEFALGKGGEVMFATSVKLGHVTLTEDFVKNGEIENMRKKIRSVIEKSGLTEKVKDVGFDVAVGSSGTIRSIGKALSTVDCIPLREFGVCWRFSGAELALIRDKLLNENVPTRIGFSKRRAEFILAGAVLLWEIFDLLGIAEMEVSEYGLAEGVLAEIMAKELEEFDFNANTRWRSVVRLATRFSADSQIRLAVRCVGITKEIFETLRKYNELSSQPNESPVVLDDKDLEYTEAAILLHGVGLSTGRKGHHKQSYHIIKNGGYLNGYKANEVELIALLARFHRKKFPDFDHTALKGLKKEVKQKVRVLSSILRISLALQQLPGAVFHKLDISHSTKDFKLVLCKLNDQSPISKPVLAMEMEHELKHFREVLQHDVSIIVLPPGT